MQSMFAAAEDGEIVSVSMEVAEWTLANDAEFQVFVKSMHHRLFHVLHRDTTLTECSGSEPLFAHLRTLLSREMFVAGVSHLTELGPGILGFGTRVGHVLHQGGVLCSPRDGQGHDAGMLSGIISIALGAMLQGRVEPLKRQRSQSSADTAPLFGSPSPAATAGQFSEREGDGAGANEDMLVFAPAPAPQATTEAMPSDERLLSLMKGLRTQDPGLQLSKMAVLLTEHGHTGHSRNRIKKVGKRLNDEWSSIVAELPSIGPSHKNVDKSLASDELSEVVPDDEPPDIHLTLEELVEMEESMTIGEAIAYQARQGRFLTWVQSVSVHANQEDIETALQHGDIETAVCFELMTSKMVKMYVELTNEVSEEAIERSLQRLHRSCDGGPYPTPKPEGVRAKLAHFKQGACLESGRIHRILE